jgi:hypothetical protein
MALCERIQQEATALHAQQAADVTAQAARLEAEAAQREADQQAQANAALSEKQAEQEAAEPMRVLREIRDWYLKESDWTQVADLRQIRGAEWCAAWDSYRQELRDFPDTATNIQFDDFNFLSGVTWPQRPDLK